MVGTRNNIGITLIFASKLKRGHIGYKVDYVIKVGSLKEVDRCTKLLSEKFQKMMSKKNGTSCVYLGINDIFEVDKTIKDGSILGRTTFWSKKSVKSAKGLVKSRVYNCSAYMKDIKDKDCIAELVYFLKPNLKTQSRRAIVCNILLRPLSKGHLITKIDRLGKSERLKARLMKILKKYEPSLNAELTYIGLADMRFLQEKIKVGNCSSISTKNVSKLTSLKKLVAPVESFKEVFMQSQ